MSKKERQSPRLQPLVPQPAPSQAPERIPPLSVIAPPMAHDPPVIEQIRARAYQLWLERGCPEGQSEEDWLAAEAEVLGRQNIVAA